MSDEMSQEDYIRALEAEIQRLRQVQMQAQEEKIDYQNIGEDDYSGAAITALGTNPSVVKRRTSIISPGLGESYGVAEATLIRCMPYTAGLIDILHMSTDWKSGEDGKALSEVNATLSGKYSKRYPVEKVYQHPTTTADEDGGL